MPLDVEGKLLHRLFICKVKSLLQNKRTERGEQFLGRSSERAVEMLGDLVDGNCRKDKLTKQSRPSGVEHLAPLRGQESPGIENVELIRIFRIYHLFAFNLLIIFDISYQISEEIARTKNLY